MTSNIKKVSSPSHPIDFEFGETPAEARVVLGGGEGEPLKKDFEVSSSGLQARG